MYTRSRLPFDLWIGRGRPLNPYLLAYLIEILRHEMKPKELRLPPDNLFEMPGMKHMLEWMSLRGWVKQWLKYLK